MASAALDAETARTVTDSLLNLKGLTRVAVTQRLEPSALSRYDGIIVMKNGGGGIFRFIKSTSALPELERYLEVGHDVPVKQYAEAFGFRFFDAVNEESLKTALPGFFAEAERPAILAVSTDNVASAEILKNYFCKTKK